MQREIVKGGIVCECKKAIKNITVLFLYVCYCNVSNGALTYLCICGCYG